MKKEKGKKIKFIISLISVGIFAYSYFVVYNGYLEKTTDAYNETRLVKLQILEREQMLAEEEDILTTLEEINREKQKIIDSYPVYIAKEDNFMFIEKLERNLKINITSLDVSENKGFYQTILPAVVSSTDSEDQGDEVEDQVTASDATISTMDGYVNSITMNFLTTYEGIKELSEYIRNYPEPTIIENVSVSYDSSTGALAGNLILNRFFLTGTGKEYMGIPIDGINIGTDNIFGTGESSEQDNVEINEPEDN